jgi:hypothetical protein
MKKNTLHILYNLVIFLVLAIYFFHTQFTAKRINTDNLQRKAIIELLLASASQKINYSDKVTIDQLLNDNQGSLRWLAAQTYNVSEENISSMFLVENASDNHLTITERYLRKENHVYWCYSANTRSMKVYQTLYTIKP